MPMACPTGAPTSSGGLPVCMAANWRISKPMVRWECTTPLGSAVVPDVYATRAGEDGSTTAGAVMGSPSSSWSKGIAPDGTGPSPTTATSSREGASALTSSSVAR